ncbi:MAG TPA: tRNA (uridine(34)/cytosine(34)/5-carboxymethylaminomethyluridine(34)-2'-O)-methyltransferase TrmL [Gammaproteobacteria bacterium]|nr:tRNA (uridine(34)/cytosine(34)/5-carboxymethylaminomethyluridine(34)-2'-O)-methyltransferase TrmL [Gammaproteobacteria bacterium]
MHIVLYQPEIPPNTGNIIRLVANTGCFLSIIEPMGFSWDDKQLKRAGLDYHMLAHVKRYPNWDHWIESHRPQRIFGLTTKGTTRYDTVSYQKNDTLVFGPETRGLPSDILTSLPKEQLLYIPMQAQSRSLNLSNAVAICTYEALRQTGFSQLITKGA